jgi:hypothetical protein
MAQAARGCFSPLLHNGPHNADSGERCPPTEVVNPHGAWVLMR